jgi:hypothetical protein
MCRQCCGNPPLARALGQSARLEMIDDFERHVENYVTGKSPFLRGTADMIALAGQVLKEKDRGLAPGDVTLKWVREELGLSPGEVDMSRLDAGVRASKAARLPRRRPGPGSAA